MSYQELEPSADFPSWDADQYVLKEIPQGNGIYKVFRAYFARINGKVAVNIEIWLEDPEGDGVTEDGVTLGYFDEQIPALEAAEEWLERWISGADTDSEDDE